MDLERATAWAGDVLGVSVSDVRGLSGGWTSTMLGLTVADGGRAVLRLMTKEPWRTHAHGLLARESHVQGQLAGSNVPVPRSLALDLTGSVAGDPAHLMSWLPGSLALGQAGDEMVGELARMLATVHAFDPGNDRPRGYQSWAVPAKRVVPEWARRPALWQEAFARLGQPAPPYRGTFLHRDFHLGNVLWRPDGGGISGVVDWVETSWGPAALDVAHASTYLAMLHGPHVAQRFAAEYDEQTGDQPPDPDPLYWQVLDIVGYLPGPTKVAQPWRELGRDVSDELACARLEDHLAVVMGVGR